MSRIKIYRLIIASTLLFTLFAFLTHSYSHEISKGINEQALKILTEKYELRILGKDTTERGINIAFSGKPIFVDSIQDYAAFRFSLISVPIKLNSIIFSLALFLTLLSVTLLFFRNKKSLLLSLSFGVLIPITAVISLYLSYEMMIANEIMQKSAYFAYFKNYDYFEVESAIALFKFFKEFLIKIEPLLYGILLLILNRELAWKKA